MSLNHVVNNLIRAAASIPQNISDTDLDKHVAQLLANEAKAKEKSWSELGLGAYLGRGSYVIIFLPHNSTQNDIHP